MKNRIKFTRAQINRAVKGAEDAGMKVTRVIVQPDGSIVVDSGDVDDKAVDTEKGSLASWEDA